MEHLNRLNRLDPYYHNIQLYKKYTNILTNIPIFIAGLYILSLKNKKLNIFGFHVLLLSIASSYYHTNPNNDYNINGFTIYFTIIIIINNLFA